MTVGKMTVIALTLAAVATSYIVWQYSAVAQVDSGKVQDGSEELPEKHSTKVEYHASFICGSIADASGPLRPGFYDTDINIYNRQGFIVPLLWRVVLNDGPSSNYNVKSLEGMTSTSINCEQIGNIIHLNDTESFVQGFVILRTELSPEVISALYSKYGATIPEQSIESLNVLNVQSINTVNALKTSEKQLFLYKVSFRVTEDGSGKIPVGMLSKRLYVIIPTKEYQIFDPELEVKDLLMNKFTLTQQEIDSITVKIISVSFSAESLKDDHALSIQQVKPVQVP